MDNGTIEDRVEQLLGSPRALAAVAGLAGISVRSIAQWSSEGDDPGIPDPISAWAERIGQRRGVSRAEQLLSDTLHDPAMLTAIVLERISGWAWNPDAQLARSRLLAHRQLLRGVAARLVAASGSHWWWRSLATESQILLGHSGTVPQVVVRGFDSGLSRWGWRLPRELTTSTWLSDRVPAVELCDPEVVTRLPESVGCWRVEVSPDANVYEIATPDDWRHLCERYPRVIPLPQEFRDWGIVAADALVPDWSLVAAERDGVHLTIGGLLTTAGRAMLVGENTVCMLEGVDTELTTWFRPQLKVVDCVRSLDDDDLPLQGHLY